MTVNENLIHMAIENTTWIGNETPDAFRMADWLRSHGYVTGEEQHLVSQIQKYLTGKDENVNMNDYPIYEHGITSEKQREAKREAYQKVKEERKRGKK